MRSPLNSQPGEQGPMPMPAAHASSVEPGYRDVELAMCIAATIHLFNFPPISGSPVPDRLSVAVCCLKGAQPPQSN
jgi:hypothetical protein